ncbi:cyclase family protein [Pseudodesulfovibrio sp. F-1]|uniref:Cyclase family protein n=1 Tax=Pseudodesulfovibrio alkaliphilus TaxID=2661613 RepID=A0A7K1KMD9_9BACT|nr:cyclase family protein [Pseudodesulfovibrio alkaliphilus]MUM77253.1 cyclase family protein [Pseudodesulfovibrio alkaliphilus]
MRAIDLSHIIETGMPVYPGDEATEIRCTAEIHQDGYAQTSLAMTCHAGTHVDIAAHAFADAPGLDRLGPGNFTGWGAVVDLTGLTGGTDSGLRIDQTHLARLADMDGLDFALLRTGWDARWGRDGYYRDYPTLTATACRFLAGLELKGVGLDTPSPDPVNGTTEAHAILLNHGLIIVENLQNLGELPPEGFLFCCLPLRIRNGEGSPVRATALVF